jgi:hypothetical protein
VVGPARRVHGGGGGGPCLPGDCGGRGAIDRWNVYYRSSSNGGGTWSAETDLSTPVSGYPYIFNEGFRFPFGDYFEMAVDSQGTTQVVWGEGYNYDTPGSVWYSRGK